MTETETMTETDVPEPAGDRAQLRFPAYHGPAALLAVLVREGDLNPRAVPVTELAQAVTEEAGSLADLDETLAVDVLCALTEVWAHRLGQVARPGETVLPDEGPGPEGLGAEIGWAMRSLRALEDREADVVKRSVLVLKVAHSGSGSDLVRALVRLAAKKQERRRALRLWPEPAHSPLLAQVRRLLIAVRRSAHPVAVLPAGLRRDEQVAAVQAALELCRKGRLRLFQHSPYGDILAGRVEFAGRVGPVRGEGASVMAAVVDGVP